MRARLRSDRGEVRFTQPLGFMVALVVVCVVVTFWGHYLAGVLG